MPHLASGNHLLEKDIVHVAQGEESQAQEEESPLLPPVGEVVIPQHHHGKRSQDDQSQQEVQSCDVEEDGQQHERRNEADVDLHGPREPRDAAVVRNVVDDPLQSSRGQGPAGQPPVGRENTAKGINTRGTPAGISLWRKGGHPPLSGSKGAGNFPKRKREGRRAGTNGQFPEGASTVAVLWGEWVLTVASLR